MNDLEIEEDLNPIAQNFNSQGKILEPMSNKVAIIDADTLVYKACITSQEILPMLPEEYYSEEEYKAIIDSPYYDRELEQYTHIDLEDTLSKVVDRLNNMLNELGCTRFELHFTTGRSSFRYDIFPNYKGNRPSKGIPVGLKEVKQMVKDKYTDKVFLHEDIEADDAVIARYKELFPDCILASVDKDVLGAVEGRHYNYYTKAAYVNSKGIFIHAVEPMFVEVTALDAMKHLYIQTLTGDSIDNIHPKYGTGLKGVAEKTALKILKDCTTPSECLQAVVKAYKDKRKDDSEEDILRDITLTTRLVSMHQYINNSLELEKEIVYDAGTGLYKH